jgi:hypothetical protein
MQVIARYAGTRHLKSRHLRTMYLMTMQERVMYIRARHVMVRNVRTLHPPNKYLKSGGFHIPFSAASWTFFSSG